MRRPQRQRHDRDLGRLRRRPAVAQRRRRRQRGRRHDRRRTSASCTTSRSSAAGTRHLSIDRDNNVWVSGLFGASDRGLRPGRRRPPAPSCAPRGPFACGGYGGLVDAQRRRLVGALQRPGAALRPSGLAADRRASARCIGGVASYGLAIDGEGYVWVAGPSGDRVWKIAPTATRSRARSRTASAAAQGLAVDARGDVWVSSAKWSNSSTVGHLQNDGTFVGNVTGVPRGLERRRRRPRRQDLDRQRRGLERWRASTRTLGPIGADGVTRIGQVDLRGRPAGVESLQLQRHDRLAGPRQHLAAGHLAGDPGRRRRRRRLGHDRPGTPSPRARCRRATDRCWSRRGPPTPSRASAAEPFVAVANGVAFDLTGRFLQVRVTLRARRRRPRRPVLSDLRIAGQRSDPGRRVRPRRSTTRRCSRATPGSSTALFHGHPRRAAATAQSRSTTTVGRGLGDRRASTTRRLSGAWSSPPAPRDQPRSSSSVFGDTDPEDDEIFFARARATRPARRSPTASGSAPSSTTTLRLAPVVGDASSYTLDEDFDLGRPFNAPPRRAAGSDQLQVTDEVQHLPLPLDRRLGPRHHRQDRHPHRRGARRVLDQPGQPIGYQLQPVAHHGGPRRQRLGGQPQTTAR